MIRKNKTQNESISEHYWDQIKRYGEKYPAFNWPSVELLLNLVHSYSVLSTSFDRFLAGYDMTRAAFGVLMILSRSESESCKQNDISKLMLVSRANITGLVDGLAKAGLVERKDDQADRRVNIVAILPKGKILLEKILPIYYAYVARISSKLTVSEKKQLKDLLIKLRNGINEAGI